VDGGGGWQACGCVVRSVCWRGRAGWLRAGVVRAEKCGRRAGVIIWLLSLRFKASLEFTYGLFGVEGRRFLEEKAKSGFQGC
jgi:hypothetical protein